jgi:hypothetical protein
MLESNSIQPTLCVEAAKVQARVAFTPPKKKGGLQNTHPLGVFGFLGFF